jgi:hypothetical protein
MLAAHRRLRRRRIPTGAHRHATIVKNRNMHAVMTGVTMRGMTRASIAVRLRRVIIATRAANRRATTVATTVARRRNEMPATMNGIAARRRGVIIATTRGVIHATTGAARRRVSTARPGVVRHRAMIATRAVTTAVTVRTCRSSIAARCCVNMSATRVASLKSSAS